MRKLSAILVTMALFLVSCEPNTPSESGQSGGGSGNTPVVAPTAQFSFKLQQPLAVEFTNESSNNATQLLWDFGDGSTSTEANPIHKYSSAGSYIVTLTAKNNAGSNSIRNTVNIPVPKVYVKGIKYLQVGKPNMYYKTTCKDDDIFTTTWFNTGYTPLLSNSNLPYDYIFTSSVLMSGLDEDNYYTIFVYWNTKTNGDGTQILKQKMSTSSIKQYPEQIVLTSDNKDTQVAVLFSYK